MCVCVDELYKTAEYYKYYENLLKKKEDSNGLLEEFGCDTKAVKIKRKTFTRKAALL